jgi:hypothetical protein
MEPRYCPECGAATLVSMATPDRYTCLSCRAVCEVFNVTPREFVPRGVGPLFAGDPPSGVVRLEEVSHEE